MFDLKNKETTIILFSTLAIIAVNGFGILFCKYNDANRDAQRYYKHFEPLKFYVMHFCYTILLISLTYNIRFFIMSCLQTFGKKIMKKLK